MKFTAPIIAALAATVAVAEQVPEYFLIRHAEKNPDGTISTQGQRREQCLVKVFGKNSAYNIQHIMVQTPYPGDSAEDHTTQRPYNTTLALAKSLGITIDHPCNYTDTSCAGKAALQYTGPGNVLIAWEHDHLPAVARAIGGKHVPKYPDSHFDLIYNQPVPYTKITVTSEDCAAVDVAIGTGTTMTSTSTSTSTATTTTTSASSVTSSGAAARQFTTTTGNVVRLAMGVMALLTL